MKLNMVVNYLYDESYVWDISIYRNIRKTFKKKYFPICFIRQVLFLFLKACCYYVLTHHLSSNADLIRNFINIIRCYRRILLHMNFFFWPCHAPLFPIVYFRSEVTAAGQIWDTAGFCWKVKIGAFLVFGRVWFTNRSK